MPSDIVGTEILEEDTSTKQRVFRFRGPVFTQVLLADEINRAPPKNAVGLARSDARAQRNFRGANAQTSEFLSLS